MPRKRRRISHEAAAVLALFLDDVERRWYGLEVIDAARIPSGSAYPILIRFEDRGVLQSDLEDEEQARAEGRRPRRYYRLTELGVGQAREDLAEWQREMQRRERAEARFRPGLVQP